MLDTVWGHVGIWYTIKVRLDIDSPGNNEICVCLVSYSMCWCNAIGVQIARRVREFSDAAKHGFINDATWVLVLRLGVCVPVL